MQQINAFLIHLGTGGLSHMLRLLGNSINFCKINNKICVPVLEKNRAFALDFYSVFEKTSDILLNRCKYKEIVNCEYDFNDHKFMLNEFNLKYIKLEKRGEYRASVPNFDTEVHSLHLDNLPEIKPHPISVGTYCNTNYNASEAWTASLSSMKISDSVLETIYKKQNDLPSNYIGVHYRNTDMKTDFMEICNILEKEIKKTNLDFVYWATDDLESIEKISAIFPRIKIENKSNLIKMDQLDSKSLHYAKGKTLESLGFDKKIQVVDALSDIFILSNSSSFIPSPTSSLSKLVNFFKQRRDLKTRFFGQNIINNEKTIYTQMRWFDGSVINS